MDQSAGSDSVLRAIVRNQFQRKYELYPMCIHLHWPCNHVNVATYPLVQGRISMCMLPYQHNMYSSCEHACKIWLCAMATAQNH
jgi:hypothetical protein